MTKFRVKNPEHAKESLEKYSSYTLRTVFLTTCVKVWRDQKRKDYAYWLFGGKRYIVAETFGARMRKIGIFIVSKAPIEAQKLFQMAQ